MNLRHYRQVDGKSKVLLLFLLLGGHDISKIDHYEEEPEERLFGLKIRKIYGITSEYVDTDAMEAEIEKTHCPVICSEAYFENCVQSEVLYRYEPKFEDKPLYINDMGILSNAMVITHDYIISTNRALSETEADPDNIGFMFFARYVTDNCVTIGKWLMKYDSDADNGKFDIFYQSEDESGKTHKELIYSFSSVDKPSTYKLVIYIIRKVASALEEIEPDNFKETEFRRTE